jgi:polysaccharide biosynthesis protein PslH
MKVVNSMQKVLIIIPEDQFCPPTNGGSLRVFHLLRQLGRHYEVHAVTGQSAVSLKASGQQWQLPDSIKLYSAVENPAPKFIWSSFPKRFSNALRYRWLRRSLNGPANAVFLQSAHLVEEILRRHDIDIVIFEHIEAMTLASLVKRMKPKAIRILDAHNLDHRLAEQAAHASKQDARLTREAARLRGIESQLEREVDAFIACSDDDRDALIELNGPRIHGFTIPNGVDTESLKFATLKDAEATPTLLFCGSLDYHPNSNGLSWFIRSIWPLILDRHPNARLLVVGRGSPPESLSISLESDPRVDLIGQVDDVVPYYRQSVISIVPLCMGSGTRLKVLEAMALGTPVVSTAIGAEGINCIPDTHLLIAEDSHSFAEAVFRLIDEPAFRFSLAGMARALVEEQYDWMVVGSALRKAIGTIRKAG